VVASGVSDAGFREDSRPAGARPADAGFSLIEILVAMAIMSVIGAAMTAAMVQTYKSTTRQESLTSMSFQTHLAFQRLDNEIRYAYVVRRPAANPSITGFYYVEYLVEVAGVRQCTQLRLGGRNDVLQRRTQRSGGPVGAWSALATGLGASARFTVREATESGNQHDQLTITMKVRGDVSSVYRPAQFTFTALNTAVGTSTNICTTLDRA
jgi:prepilin-type N-terminal cleavage/methylation domain-containing protein